MANRKSGERKIWTTSFEKPVFNISENRPIHALHYNWQTPQDLRYDMHYGLELGILLKGKMRRYFQSGSFDVTSGDLWLCGMWEPHGYQINTPSCQAVVLIIFPPVLAKTQLGLNHNLRLLAPFEAAPNSRPGISPSLKKKVLELAKSIKSIIDEKSKNKDVWLNLKLMETLLLLVENWIPQKITNEKYSYPAAKISKAINLVFENKRFISTQEAARICGMNRNAFGKRFGNTMGITFSEFALRYRISAAAKLLLNTDTPIKAIATEWGFTDTSHIHRCFAKYYNCSPTSYRNSKLVIHQ